MRLSPSHLLTSDTLTLISPSPSDILRPEQQPKPELTYKMNLEHDAINTIKVLYLKIDDQNIYISCS